MEVRNQVILLMGKTGVGKSTLGNLLLGRLNNDGPFVVPDRMDSETRECCVETISINGQTYDIVDTPGIFDTRQHMDPLKEIAKFVHKCAYGVKAIILVLEAKRLTSENWNTLSEIRMFLGKDAINNIIVVFSNATKEQVRDKDRMQQAWNKPVDSFIREINYRWGVFPNPDFFSFDKSTSEGRLMEIKKLITSIWSIYTTEQLEKNLRKRAEAKRLKEEEDKRKKEEYENNLRENSIKEVKETYRAELQEERRKRRTEQERHQSELRRRQQYQSETNIDAGISCGTPITIIKETMPKYEPPKPVCREVPTLEKDKHKFTSEEMVVFVACIALQGALGAALLLVLL